MTHTGTLKLTPRVRLFFGVLFAVFIVLTLPKESQMRQLHRRSLDWPETPGQLVDAYETERISRRRMDIVVHVKYRYTVDEKVYMNDQISYARVPDARKYVQLFNDGQPISVKYNPDNPAESVLEHGDPISKTESIWGVILMGFLSLALIVSAFIWR